MTWRFIGVGGWQGGGGGGGGGGLVGVRVGEKSNSWPKKSLRVKLDI